MTRRRLTKEDLTPDNITTWTRVGWPYGIKGDLAKDFPISSALGEGERLVNSYDSIKSPKYKKVVIAQKVQDDILLSMRVFKIYYPHPGKVVDGTYGWRRGKGFIITNLSAAAWSSGITSMLKYSPHIFKTIKELPLHIIRYPSGKKRIHFIVTRKGRNWYYQIQEFWRKYNIWIPTRRCVSFRAKDRKMLKVIRFWADRLATDERIILNFKTRQDKVIAREVIE